MKKILGVAFIGGLLVALLIVMLRREKNEIRSEEAAVATASAVATTAAPVDLKTASPSAARTDVSDAATCKRVAELCTTSDQKVDASDCEKKLADARKMSGSSNVERSEKCVLEANTCAAASGCISGGVGMGAMGEFLKGLG